LSFSTGGITEAEVFMTPATDHADAILKLVAAPSVEYAAQRASELARELLHGDAASVLLVDRGKLRTSAAAGAGDVLEKADQLQLEVSEGPALAVLDDHEDVVLVEDVLADHRWPVWGPRAAEVGVINLLSCRISVDTDRLGALQLHSADRSWRADDVAAARILARQIALALRSARHLANLREAVDGRTTIGQAQGILMERLQITEEEAFAMLRRYSQANNVKLSQVARDLVSTRALPGTAQVVSA
jgi:GAF domain-containing protein